MTHLEEWYPLEVLDILELAALVAQEELEEQGAEN